MSEQQYTSYGTTGQYGIGLAPSTVVTVDRQLAGIGDGSPIPMEYAGFNLTTGEQVTQTYRTAKDVEIDIRHIERSKAAQATQQPATRRFGRRSTRSHPLGRVIEAGDGLHHLPRYVRWYRRPGADLGRVVIRVLTAAEIETIHGEAAAAVRACLAAGPDAPAGEQYRLNICAGEAVTEAVRTLGISHRSIALAASSPGLMVAGMITDPELRAKALVVELHHARRYEQQIRGAQAAHARSWYGQGGVVEKTALARALDVSRPTLDRWLGVGEQA